VKVNVTELITCIAYKCFTKTANINVQKLTSLNFIKLSVKDENYDACKTANIKIQVPEVLQVGSSTLERLLSESSRSYMLIYLLISCLEDNT
jgi:hypothetical protein